MDAGIVHDGVTIRYMTEREQDLWQRHGLPEALTVIVAPCREPVAGVTTWSLPDHASETEEFPR